MVTGEMVITVAMSSSGDDEAVVDNVGPTSAVHQQKCQRRTSQVDDEGEVEEGSVLETVVSLEGSDVDLNEGVNGSCCRICMEDVTEEDFSNETALRLGCRCMDGLDVVHTHCAKKWFRLKRSLNCEICGYSVNNLPEKFQRKLQKLIEQTRRVDFRSEDEADIDSTTELEAAHLRTFAVILYGFMPALLCFLSVMFFFHGVLRIDIATSVVLAFALSTSTLMHFIMESRSGTWHLVFVLLYLVTVLSMASAFYFLYDWEGIAAAIAGTLLGPMTAVVLFALLKSSVLFCCPVWHLWTSTVIVFQN